MQLTPKLKSDCKHQHTGNYSIQHPG